MKTKIMENSDCAPFLIVISIFVLAGIAFLLVDLFDPGIVYRDFPYRVRIERNDYQPDKVYIKMQHGPGGGYAYYKESANIEDHELINIYVSEAIRQIPIQKRRDEDGKLKRKSFRLYQKELKR